MMYDWREGEREREDALNAAAALHDLSVLIWWDVPAQSCSLYRTIYRTKCSGYKRSLDTPVTLQVFVM